MTGEVDARSRAGTTCHLDRLARISELDAYLADLDAELGPVPRHELRAAREWADAVLPTSHCGTARAVRSA